MESSKNTGFMSLVEYAKISERKVNTSAEVVRLDVTETTK